MADKLNMSEFAAAMVEAINGTEEQRHAVAEKIVKYVSDSVEQMDVASLVLPKETIPVGTSAEFALPGKLKAYWHEPGSYAPRTAMAQKVFTVPTWMLSVHPEYEISQLEAGRYGTVQDQIKAARDAMLGAINARVFNTLTGSIATTDANYGTCSGKLSRYSLDNAINWVEDQAGGAKAIIGRRNLLFQMLEFNVIDNNAIYGEQTKNYLMNNTKLPSYRGIPVIGLPQWRDAFGKVTIPQDEVLVVGNDVGKYVVNEEIKSRDGVDIDTLVWHLHIYMKMGAAVFFPERMFRLKVS